MLLLLFTVLFASLLECPLLVRNTNSVTKCFSSYLPVMGCIKLFQQCIENDFRFTVQLFNENVQSLDGKERNQMFDILT